MDNNLARKSNDPTKDTLCFATWLVAATFATGFTIFFVFGHTQQPELIITKLMFCCYAGLGFVLYGSIFLPCIPAAVVVRFLVALAWSGSAQHEYSRTERKPTSTSHFARAIQPWPSPQDYNESIQSSLSCFADEELLAAEPEPNAFGLPKPISGNFASVYHLYNDRSEWAVRCFLQPLADQEQRYRALSAALAGVNAPYLVGFSFIDRGLRVGSQWFPILKMEWVRGLPLLLYIEKHLEEASVLQALAESFKKTVLNMQSHNIAHGDLQHGNIFVEGDGRVRLVDYDGCFVGELSAKMSNELGHPNYQHPQRTRADFNASMDNFSAWLIWISIVCLAEDYLLWDKLGSGDECLLFRYQDMANPRHSWAFHVLESHSAQSIHLKARFLRSLIGMKPSEIPSLSEPVSDPKGLPLLGSVISPQARTNKPSEQPTKT